LLNGREIPKNYPQNNAKYLRLYEANFSYFQYDKNEYLDIVMA